MKKFAFNGITYDTLTDAQDVAYLAALDCYGATDDFNTKSLDDPHYYKSPSNEETEYYDDQLNDLINSFFESIKEIEIPVHVTKIMV